MSDPVTDIIIDEVSHAFREQVIGKIGDILEPTIEATIAGTKEVAGDIYGGIKSLIGIRPTKKAVLEAKKIIQQSNAVSGPLARIKVRRIGRGRSRKRYTRKRYASRRRYARKTRSKRRTWRTKRVYKKRRSYRRY